MIDSPCIRKCSLVDNICQGCGRTLEDIRNWMFMDDIDKSMAMFRAAKNLESVSKSIEDDQRNHFIF